MPGIHVHTFSQLDWLDQEKESLLTVPGSYWLCHKKNIYKFIFKYHRATKSTTQFSYGKELLKIIRRIIKCHPSQGQQFGTQHLLVTYNCTSWTRQDKMFAILKFQQRTNAATFSHAFVLTIKICSSSEEETLFNLKYSIVKEVNTGTGYKDSNDTKDIDEKATKTVIHPTDKVSSKKLRVYAGKRINQILKHSEKTINETSEASVNSTLQNMEKFANLREKSDGRAKNATTCTVTKDDFTDKHNIESDDNMYVNNSTNCDNRRSEKNTEQNPVAHRQDQLRTAKRKDEKKDEIKEVDKTNEKVKRAETQRQHQETPKIRKYQIFSASKSSSSTGIIKDCSVSERLLNKSNSNEESMRQDHATDNKTNSDDNDDIDKSIVDSSKALKPYFIKKDLDNAKQDRASAKLATFPPIVNKSMQENSQQGTFAANENFVSKMEGEKVNEESLRRKYRNDTADQSSDKQLVPISIRTFDDCAQNNMYGKSYKGRKQRNKEFFEKKTVADDKVLRSSNITDLVMEGLMFTIRQDQDSVAVIEQKTKLEVDEVLENSEKVETEAGEKCLLNSSLLRLENLITMIDPPRDKDDQHKPNHRMIDNTACHLDDINYVDTTPNKLNNPNYERRSFMDKSSPCGFVGWQQQQACSTVVNNDSYAANRNAMENWEIDDHKRDKKYMHHDDIEIINEEEKVDVEEVQDEEEMENEKKIEDEEEMEDEEEDIVPEVFRSTIFSPEKTSPLDTELLMDDIDVEETSKLDMSMKDSRQTSSCYSSSFNKIPMSESPTISERSKRETNIPRVISNKAITVEQIPLALQKILRHTRRFYPVASETSATHSDKEKIQITTSTKDTVSETSATSDQSNPREFHWQRAHSDVANSDSHLTDRNPVEKNEQLMEWEDDDHERDEECTKNASSKTNRGMDSDTANESVIKITNDTEKTTNEDKDESRVMTDLEDVAESSNGNARHIEEKKNETHRTSQSTSSTGVRTRHSSPRKLQDITEDFYHDLHAHNKNNATQQRCLRQRRRSLNNPEDIKNGKMRIEMLKFIQDMREGVKVVVKRLDLDNMANLS